MVKIIKHAIDKERMEKEGEARYLCNQAYYPKYQKITLKYSEITCLRCLHLLY